MPARPTHPDIALAAPGADAVARSDADRLRTLVIAAGVFWSAVFVVVGLRYQLQMYGDGAMFSYSVAAQSAWAFHWHNISGRLTVYLLTLLPAEAYVGLTGDPSAGIVVYGLLFLVAPLLGLIATYAADRSKGHVIFVYACFSTVCLCPLVFGFPTEMWMAHVLFWPSLAVAHYARRTVGGAALLFVLLLLLILTHEGALVLAAAIVATLLPRGMRDKEFLRAAGALFVAVLVWAAVKLIIRPDAYFAGVLARAALDFFDLNIFTGDLVRLLFATIASSRSVHAGKGTYLRNFARRCGACRLLAIGRSRAPCRGPVLPADDTCHRYARIRHVGSIARASHRWRADSRDTGSGAHHKCAVEPYRRPGHQWRIPAGDAGARGGDRKVRRGLDAIQDCRGCPRHRHSVRSFARRSAFRVIGSHWCGSQSAILVFDDALSVRDRRKVCTDPACRGPAGE
jgi:hypothetical protein